MRRLLLLRHAKAAAGEPDIDRPLTSQGRRAAALVGEHLAKHELLPDRILCSSSRRTRETFAALVAHLRADTDVKLSRLLYEAGNGHYLDQIGRYGATAQTLLVVGHNPAMQETAALLIGAGNTDLRDEVANRFPTAGLAVIDFDRAKWDDIAPRSGRIVAFFRPRDLEIVGGEKGGAEA
ncbi:MAG: histidine phosphatase family protein [Bauldia sp.]